MGIEFKPMHALYIFMLCATNCVNYIYGIMYIGKEH